VWGGGGGAVCEKNLGRAGRCVSGAAVHSEKRTKHKKRSNNESAKNNVPVEVTHKKKKKTKKKRQQQTSKKKNQINKHRRTRTARIKGSLGRGNEKSIG